MADTFQPATVVDYVTWLGSYLGSGSMPTHYYDYPMWRWTFLVAQEDFRMGGECGAQSVSIIVPEGITYSGIRGHNDLFLWEGPAAPSGVVPVFNDPPFAALGLNKFIAAEQHRQAVFERQIRSESAAANLRAARSDIGRYLGRKVES